MTFRRRKREHGFNLIESLIVMLAIILLASIVIPGLMGKRGEPLKLPERPIKKPIPTKVETPARSVAEEAPAEDSDGLGAEGLRPPVAGTE